MAPIIVWFRRNLRLTDNEALSAACETGRPIIALYVHDSLDVGSASRWWLHHSLLSLGETLRSRGCELLIRSGTAESEILSVRIADPGGNLLEGHQPQLPGDERPLTLAAAAAVQQRQGIEINTEGYRDYRGVRVLAPGSGMRG